MEYGGSPSGLRTRNTQSVLEALKGERVATKQRLAQLTGLSTVTVNTALEFLVEKGVAVLDEVVPSNGGRPARSYRFNEQYRYGLALCIRDQTLLIRVASLYGDCILREEEPLGRADGERFRPVVERLLERYPEIGAVGFGLPGVVRDGYITLSDHSGLTGVRLAEDYERWYGLPTAVENDVNLAVLGYERGTDSVAYLYFPDREAPGAGVLLGGALHRGRHGLAGEIRCLPPGIDWRGLDRGDFEAVCDAVSQAVKAYACVLDPERIVLYGSFLTPAHREAVAWNCAQDMDIGFLPGLVLAEDFDADYERGAVRLALSRLSL